VEGSNTVVFDVQPLSAHIFTPGTKWTHRYTYETALVSNKTAFERRHPNHIAKHERPGLHPFWEKVKGFFDKIGALGEDLLEFFTHGRINWDGTHTFTFEGGRRERLLGRP